MREPFANGNFVLDCVEKLRQPKIMLENRNVVRRDRALANMVSGQAFSREDFL